MNPVQRTILVVGAVLYLAVSVYVPWVSPDDKQQWVYYAASWKPSPSKAPLFDNKKYEIDYSRIKLVQSGVFWSAILMAASASSRRF